MLTRLTRLIGRAPLSSAATGAAPGSGPAAEPDAAGELASKPSADTPPGWLDEDVSSILRQKILMDWLRNRHQLQFPHTLQRLDERKAKLAFEAAAVAAIADGASEQTARKRLSRLERELQDHAGLVASAQQKQSRPINEILSQVDDIDTASIVYAACLLASDRRVSACRLWLRYLAARLALPDQLVDSLELRYASEQRSSTLSGGGFDEPG